VSPDGIQRNARSQALLKGEAEAGKGPAPSWSPDEASGAAVPGGRSNLSTSRESAAIPTVPALPPLFSDGGRHGDSVGFTGSVRRWEISLPGHSENSAMFLSGNGVTPPGMTQWTCFMDLLPGQRVEVGFALRAEGAGALLGRCAPGRCRRKQKPPVNRGCFTTGACTPTVPQTTGGRRDSTLWLGRLQRHLRTRRQSALLLEDMQPQRTPGAESARAAAAPGPLSPRDLPLADGRRVSSSRTVAISGIDAIAVTRAWSCQLVD
jgi:hypothetical protein